MNEKSYSKGAGVPFFEDYYALAELSYASIYVSELPKSKEIKQMKAIINGWCNSISEGRMTNELVRGAIDRIRTNRPMTISDKELRELIAK